MTFRSTLRACADLLATAAPPRQGATLLELLVTLGLIGILSTVATLASRTPPPAADPAAIRIINGRHSALASGQPVSMAVTIRGARHLVTALPDGGLVADSELRLDRLTARRQDTLRPKASHER